MQTNSTNQMQIFSVSDYSVWSNIREPISIPIDFPILLNGIFLFICIQGRAKLSLDLREQEIAENSICTILPGSIITCIETSDDLLFQSLFFSFDFVSEMPPVKSFSFVDKIKRNPVQPIPPEDLDKMLSYFSLIEKLHSDKGRLFSDRSAKGLIYSLYSEIASIYYTLQVENENVISSRKEEILSLFFSLLREYSYRERNVAFYADKMCLTPKHLSASIKKASGKSVFEWINTSSITRAKILLKMRDKTIQQIAEELSFPNSSFFCQFFKKHTGMTPNEYRKS